MLQNAQILHKVSKFKVACQCSRCQSTFICNPYDARKSRVGGLCLKCKRRLFDLKNPTQSDLLQVFDYDEESGEIRHKLDTWKASAGDLATYEHGEGYLTVSLGGKEYLAHRLIWLMKQGYWPYQIDHVDHNRSNNAWSNLREVLGQDNQKNMSKKRSNSSGVTGVRILPTGKFCAYIMVNRKQISLGSYDVLEEAVHARSLAEQRYGFHPNHGS
jgi:hypothetical protein